MPRHPIASTLIVLTTVACASQPLPEWPRRDGSSAQTVDAAVVRQAAGKAQATLDEFLVKAAQLPAGTKGHAVKVGIRDGPATEYFWVDEFSWSDGQFRGRIVDEPRLVTNVKPGQMHRFSRFDIVDWIYIDENIGTTFGNFTACALAGKEAVTPSAASPRRTDPACS